MAEQHFEKRRHRRLAQSIKRSYRQRHLHTCHDGILQAFDELARTTKQRPSNRLGADQRPRAGRLQHQRVADNAFHLRISADRVVRNSVLHLAGGFHDLSLHHRHYVCHVSTKLLHGRFSDWRAVKISKRLQLVRCEIFHHRVYHRFG